MKLYRTLMLASLVALPVIAEEPAPTTGTTSNSLDQKKISYAYGMNLALQVKQLGADVDVAAVAQAIKDVQQGKPTKLAASELRPLFKQEEEFARFQMSAKDKAEGAAFLAQNATKPGITVLPDGLQYRVLKSGSGAVPKVGDYVAINYRGTLIDGTEFSSSENFRANLVTQMKGWQEALKLMKVGAKWQIFLPPTLAYGRNWLQKVGPESTVIFEIELVSIDTAPSQTQDPHLIQ